LPLHTEIIECKTPYTISVLSNIVDRVVIRCLNANNIKRAIQCIHPSQRANEDNIIELCLDSFKKNLKNTILQIEFTNALEYDTEKERDVELQKLELQKADLEYKMAAISQRVKEAKEERCIICFDDIVQRTIVNCCNNSFCFKCLSVWLANKPTCPMCKAPATIKDMYVIESSENSRSNSSSDDGTKPVNAVNAVNADNAVNAVNAVKTIKPPKRPNSPSHTVHANNHKVVNLLNIIKMSPTNKKTLVFSQHDETFESIIIALRESHISYSFLKGPCASVTNIIERFKQGEVQVLLINPENYGSGLNLECTTDVIMFHKLDSEMEKQVIGRANRYGRSTALNVWYLLHANEIPRKAAAP
jgi:SNF2 family DNA or RNA helicase